jgi:CheY-like chemotaxis protein
MITIQAGYAVVIDDEPANRDFVERLLLMAGFKVSSAANGKDGLAAAQAVPELAIALVDHELPDATGLEIIKKLRADNPESLLVMATMHDHRSLIEEAFEVGIDIFLVKPHGFMELYRRLQDISPANMDQFRQLIIDQYGPRPYKAKRQTQVAKPVDAAAETPVPAAASAPVTVAPTVPASTPAEPSAAPVQNTPIGSTPTTPTTPPTQNTPTNSVIPPTASTSSISVNPRK